MLRKAKSSLYGCFTNHKSPLIIESTSLANSRKLIREKIIPWEGLARAGIISNDQADTIKVLESQNAESKRETVLNSLELYTKTILNLLNKLDVNGRDDVLKSVLVLINDLLIDEKGRPFLDSLLGLSQIDQSLPFTPFVKHLDNNDQLIKTLSFYNLDILLVSFANNGSKVDDEILIKLFDLACSKSYIGNVQDPNSQSIGIQLLQELVTHKAFKKIFQEHNLISNFKSINQIIENLAKQPNAANIQLSYNVLVTVWVMSFSGIFNKTIVHNFPQLIGNLLTLSKESIKLKVVRMAISTLRNFVSVTTSHSETVSVVKLVLFHDGLNIVKTVQTRKFASETSDEELANDLAYLNETLTEVVSSKLSSMDEYLVELENPELLSWSSPTHKSADFWQVNSHSFEENHYALVRKMLAVLTSQEASENGGAVTKVILLNDLQFLIKNLGNGLISFLNTEKGGQYKLLIMSFLENNGGDNELKYEALKTIQYLVGHA